MAYALRSACVCYESAEENQRERDRDEIRQSRTRHIILLCCCRLRARPIASTRDIPGCRFNPTPQPRGGIALGILERNVGTVLLCGESSLVRRARTAIHPGSRLGASAAVP